MYQGSIDVENPFDGGVAKAYYKHYEVGDRVGAIDYSDFEIRPATVTSVSPNPRVVSSAELWVEHMVCVKFDHDGMYQTMMAGDLGLLED